MTRQDFSVRIRLNVGDVTECSDVFVTPNIVINTDTGRPMYSWRTHVYANTIHLYEIQVEPDGQALLFVDNGLARRFAWEHSSDPSTVEFTYNGKAFSLEYVSAGMPPAPPKTSTGQLDRIEAVVNDLQRMVRLLAGDYPNE